jgi:hypothetical protein
VTAWIQLQVSKEIAEMQRLARAASSSDRCAYDRIEETLNKRYKVDDEFRARVLKYKMDHGQLVMDLALMGAPSSNRSSPAGAVAESTGGKRVAAQMEATHNSVPPMWPAPVTDDTPAVQRVTAASTDAGGLHMKPFELVAQQKTEIAAPRGRQFGIDQSDPPVAMPSDSASQGRPQSGGSYQKHKEGAPLIGNVWNCGTGCLPDVITLGRKNNTCGHAFELAKSQNAGSSLDSPHDTLVTRRSVNKHRRKRAHPSGDDGTSGPERRYALTAARTHRRAQPDLMFSGRTYGPFISKGSKPMSGAPCCCLEPTA